MKTTWNLELLYKNAADPALEKDIKIYEAACTAFEKKYKKLISELGYFSVVKNILHLFDALKEYELLYSMPGAARAYAYFNYRKDINSSDEQAESMLNKLSQRLTAAGNKLLFFEIVLGKIPKDIQKTILAHKNFSHFKYFLERLFLTSRI